MHYNLLVIGSGSGGIATARRAAYHSKLLGSGLKIGVIERDIENLIGGTCVSRGCVPKKVMWSAATIADTINHTASAYGFRFDTPVKHKFEDLVKGREAYTLRLRGIYKNNLKEAGIDLIPGFAKFVDAHSRKLLVTDEATGEAAHFTADNILVATGGQSVIPPNVVGAEHCIDSDGFFRLTQLPKSAIVIGGGNIAVELAGVLNALGTDTTVCLRGEKVLRSFDAMLVDELMIQMKQNGIKFETGFSPSQVTVQDGLKVVSAVNGKALQAEVILIATGRSSKEFLEKTDAPAGIRSSDGKSIQVDEFHNTSIPGIFAVGDVIGKAQLTPVAIAAGRRLADRLFGGIPQAKISYENIPTVIFSHPPIGTVGLTEEDARKKFQHIRVYTSGFIDSRYGILPVSGPPKPKTRMKLVCQGADERIVGLHVIGVGADEMLQGFAVAVKMNATKADFDDCIAIHPTASEEFVTMAPWGLF